jgi:hypothetical protein
MVKPDLDTLVTEPEEPPAAGPDRALDPPPADPGGPAAWALDAGCVADAAGDVARPTESATMGASIAAATMRRHFFFVSTRRTFGFSVSTELTAVGDADFVDRSRSVSWRFGS